MELTELYNVAMQQERPFQTWWFREFAGLEWQILKANEFDQTVGRILRKNGNQSLYLKLGRLGDLANFPTLAKEALLACGYIDDDQIGIKVLKTSRDIKIFSYKRSVATETRIVSFSSFRVESKFYDPTNSNHPYIDTRNYFFYMQDKKESSDSRLQLARFISAYLDQISAQPSTPGSGPLK